MVSTSAVAEVKEYIRDYNYHANMFDTEYTSRINAIDGVKRELLEEIGTYVHSVIEINTNSLGDTHMSKDLSTMTAGVVKLKVMDEKWNKPLFYVKANMKANPDEVLENIKQLRNDLELEKALRNSNEALEQSRAEVTRLKAQLAQDQLAAETRALGANTVSTSAVPADTKVALSRPAAPGGGETPGITQLKRDYVNAVKNVEVEQAFQVAMAARLRGDFETSLAEFRKLAEAGYGRAQIRMGFIYERGLGVEQDYKKAFEWYQKGVANGAMLGLARIGWMHERGLGFDKNYYKAVSYYKRAAEEGVPWGYAFLGYLYQIDRGVDRNMRKAYEHYVWAADKGNYFAKARLGFLYQQGLVVEKDTKKAVALYREAVDHGQPFAMARLGLMYAKGWGVPEDHRKAAALIRESVRYQNPLGIALTGFMYEQGIDVKRNYRQARKWYEKAADLEAPFAEFRLGVMYLKGLGVSRNKRKAKNYLESAASKGVERAEMILDRMKYGGGFGGGGHGQWGG